MIVLTQDLCQVKCDQCWREFEGLYDSTKAARQAARNEGWITKRYNGKLLDRCWKCIGDEDRALYGGKEKSPDAIASRRNMLVSAKRLQKEKDSQRSDV